MKEQPKSVAIIGSGAIGVEFAYFLNAFGTDVTILEIRLLVPVEDEEVAKSLERAFKKQKIKSELGIEIKSAEVGDKSVKIEYERAAGDLVGSGCVIQAVAYKPIWTELWLIPSNWKLIMASWLSMGVTKLMSKAYMPRVIS